MADTTFVDRATQIQASWLNDVNDFVYHDQVSITRFGAVAGTDCAQALIDAGAATTGQITVPVGAFVATLTTLNSASILALLNRIRVAGTLALTASSGTHNFTQQVVINSPDAQRITINGVATVNTTVTSQVSVSGSAKAYSVVLGVTSSAGIAVGDYALIRQDVAGTGDFYAHAGAWKVTAVDAGGANRITVLNTHHGAAFPTNTITGGTVRIRKTIFKFTGSDGFRFEGGQPLGSLDRIHVAGDWNLAAATGTTGAHGVIVASPVITGGGSSNATYNPGGLVILGQDFSVSEFGEQGIAVSGRGAMVANFVASCSNRKRGWYAEGASIRAKFSIGSGNGEDGYIADTSGFLQAALSIASGNGLNGFWSTNNSLLASATSVASGNLAHGFEARGVTRTGGDACIALNNTLDGFSAADGAMIDADSATSTGNGRDGYRAVNNAMIDANNSSSTNNGAFGYNSQVNSLINAAGSGSVSGNTSGSYSVVTDALITPITGASVPGTNRSTTALTVVNSATDLSGGRLTSSSIGDVTLAMDGPGTGTYTAQYVFKADGTQHPQNDNTQLLGRSTNRYLSVFGTNLRPGAGTVTWTSGVGTPEGAVTAVVGSLFTRTDGGASTTLYVKETGAGNTGWVAK